VTHALSPITTSTDSRWSVPLLMSLLYRGDSDLDEYGEKLRADWHDWTIECVNGDGQAQPSPRTGCPPGSHAYSFYPLGTPVLAAPIFVVVDGCVRVLGPASNRLYGNYLTPDARSFLQGEYLACFAFVERILASVIIGLTAALMFLTVRHYLPTGGSLLLSALFAFGTSAWSTASRALWQHGPDMLM